MSKWFRITVYILHEKNTTKVIKTTNIIDGKKSIWNISFLIIPMISIAKQRLFIYWRYYYKFFIDLRSPIEIILMKTMAHSKTKGLSKLYKYISFYTWSTSRTKLHFFYECLFWKFLSTLNCIILHIKRIVSVCSVVQKI